MAYHKHCQLALLCDGIINEEEVRTHELNLNNLKKLQDLHNGIAVKLKNARRTLAEGQAEMCRVKVGGQHSIEAKIFSVLKEIGVELRSYHGGSLNGKDIKKVMNNATGWLPKFA